MTQINWVSPNIYTFRWNLQNYSLFRVLRNIHGIKKNGSVIWKLCISRRFHIWSFSKHYMFFLRSSHIDTKSIETTVSHCLKTSPLWNGFLKNSLWKNNVLACTRRAFYGFTTKLRISVPSILQFADIFLSHILPFYIDT